MVAERRRYPRYKADIEVEYDVENEVEIESKTHTYNISKVGLSIPVSKAVRPGRKVYLKMKIRYDEKEVRAIGRIVWKRPVDKTLVQEENAGIEFVEMDEGSKNGLTDYIQSIAKSA